MPADSTFVDINVLLYSFDARETVKCAQARRWLDYLWRTGEGRMSWQVLHEFYANAIRKLRVPPIEVREAVSLFSRWRPGGINFAVVERGLVLGGSGAAFILGQPDSGFRRKARLRNFTKRGFSGRQKLRGSAGYQPV